MATVPVTYKKEDLVRFLGFWFDRLGRHLLHEDLVTYNEWDEQKNKRPFDIYSGSLHACVELKGGSSNNQMKLFEDQLERQLKDLGFPYDDGFVLIFSYRNCQRRGGKRVSLLEETEKTPRQISSFLASNVNVAYAIDLRLLNELRRFYGTKEYTRDEFNVRRLIFLSRTRLREAAMNLRETLEDIGMEGESSKYLPHNASSVRPRFIQTTLDGQDIGFELIPLIPHALKVRLLKKLNGAVRRN